MARRGPVLTVELTAGARTECLTRGKGKAAVVGDLVFIDDGLVAGIAPRKTELARTDLMRRRRQVLAANLDRIYVVSAVEPPLKPGLIDRYLVAAHAQGIDAAVIVNKADLITDAEEREDLDEMLAPYPDLGYPVLWTSATTAHGLDALLADLAGRCAILVGHSGVGKTSLLNALVPDLAEAVQALSEGSGRGQHTTTTTTLYRLPCGGELIDSPGVRSFGLWGVGPDDLKHHFPEFADPAQRCRFADCRHDAEPACAVQDAVEAGEIAESRYESYLRIRDSLIEELATMDLHGGFPKP